eukprot:Tbor_TRINITY_DN1971_c0_g1::TRINITY_DN1971_c0_g1_i1::g.3570::m.3570/K00357/QDPR; dihydropteridine reductase
MSRNVLVFGGGGALGSSVIKLFTARNWQVCAVGHSEVNSKFSPLGNIILSRNHSIEDMQKTVLDGVKDTKFDAVINVAGGWAGGDVADSATAANTELMIRQSIFTSIVSCHVASLHGNPRSMVVLSGSAAALKPTSFMVGYGLAKAAVHHLVRSAASDPSKLPKDCCIVGILPYTLDTPANRSGMPDADFSSWTPLEYASEDIVNWSENINRPESGALVVWKTEKGVTTNTIQ